MKKHNQPLSEQKKISITSLPNTVKSSKPIFLSRSTLKKHVIDCDLTELLLSILCINCQEMIPVELIAKHSKACIAVTEEVKIVESTYSVDEWIFKIQKLKNFLENTIKSHLKPVDKNTIIVLLRVMNQIIIDYSDESLTNATISLNGIMENFRGTFNTRIYIERLFSLLNSLEKVVKNNQDIKNDDAKELIKVKTRPTKDLKIKTDYFKSEKDIVENKFLRNDRSKSPYGKKIEDIDSDLGSKKSDCSWVSTAQYDFSPLTREDDMSPILKKVYETCDEDMQKYFYSLCLGLKIKYSQKEKGKVRLSNRKMFRQAIDTGIPPEEWYSFINSQINDPDPKLLLGPPRKRTNIKTLQSFESIIEEKTNS
ncbi:hypothetical protein SteCoe_26252 [Stentor coeruleus]|uniref:Uncharacterized protein n=1 Tax=Stentor coeruleus TaxID=5963 RepID=A0A1R2BD95_9CILI|nr:hypothetical protein SteCoe_26252 [Stentor coeruleus]